MSVLIRGMEMPQKCGKCKLYHVEHPMHCMAVEGHRTVGAPYGMSRPDWCPLIELPPHGNLKDESDIISLIEVMFCKDNDGMEHAIQCVKDAPTVIEAEGEKDGR